MTWGVASMGDLDRISPRATVLADRLTEARDALASVLERVDGKDWLRVPAPGVWSPSRDAEWRAMLPLRTPLAQ